MDATIEPRVVGTAGTRPTLKLLCLARVPPPGTLFVRHAAGYLADYISAAGARRVRLASFKYRSAFFIEIQPGIPPPVSALMRR